MYVNGNCSNAAFQGFSGNYFYDTISEIKYKSYLSSRNFLPKTLFCSDKSTKNEVENTDPNS